MVAMSGGPTLEIPAGALDKSTTVTITQSAAQADGALSAVYDFGPPGTTFSKPATVTFTVPAGTATGSVYWTTSQSAAHDQLPTLIEGAAAVAQIDHFGRGFVGAPCGTGTAPACAVRRDVTGAFETVFWTDDGTRTRAKMPRPGVTVSALVPTAAGGYQRVPGVFSADGSSFTIHAVPAGRYFLQIDGMPQQQGPILYEFTTSTPDLSSVVSYRPDLMRAASSTPVTRRPDASKGDVVWFYQAKHQSIGAGPAAAVYLPATKAARISNLTLRDGTPATVEVPPAPIPQTGTMTADVRYSQFATLAADVNASATSHELAFNVFAIPHGSQYPDMPQDSMVVRPLLLAYDFTTGSASLPDTNYGTVAYGQFGDQPLCQEFRQILYFYDVPISAPGLLPDTWLAVFAAHEAMSSAPIAPALGPVRTPKVNGRTLFQPQGGVGLQPTISWSPPALGTATSVVVNITALDGGPGLQATVRSGTSFTVPPGILAAGRAYVAILTAQQASWDRPDAPPLRFGVPYYTADCITSSFTP